MAESGEVVKRIRRRRRHTKHNDDFDYDADASCDEARRQSVDHQNCQNRMHNHNNRAAAYNGKLKTNGNSHQKQNQQHHHSAGKGKRPSPPGSDNEGQGDEEPHMITPDDPVIHSPPSIGHASHVNNGYGSTSHDQGKSNSANGDGYPNSKSPEAGGESGSDTETRRLNKTCRVCGDHATGYNFNVITCESCKAFFRRNALRPKEFKCPYSDDCVINAVSRRFCQKCRLKKCFKVGMKKEWILNDDQLKRRKNSRLNNLTSQKKQATPPGVTIGNMPLGAQNAAFELARQQHALAKAISGTIQQSPQPPHLNINQQRTSTSSMPTLSPLLTPPAQAYPIVSPNSTLTESLGLRASVLPPTEKRSPDVFDISPHLQHLHMASPPTVVPPVTPTLPVEIGEHVMLSKDEYQALLSQIPRSQTQNGGQMQKCSLSCNMPSSGQQQLSSHMASPTFDHSPTGINANSFIMSQTPESSRQLSSSYSMSEPQYPTESTQNSSVPPCTSDIIQLEDNRQMPMADSSNFSPADIQMQQYGQSPQGQQPPMNSNFMSQMMKGGLRNIPMLIRNELEEPIGSKHQQILDDLQIDIRDMPMPQDDPSKKLTPWETQLLDGVAAAFNDLDDYVDSSRNLESLMKDDKKPSDVLNIMDITMRRIVKMTKRLPGFNDLSQDCKYAMLKSTMVQLLTVRGLTRYNPQLNAWLAKTPTAVTTIPFDMFDMLNVKVSQEQKMKTHTFFNLFDAPLRKNELGINLILIVCLFNVSGNMNFANSEDSTIAETWKHRYFSLLAKYIDTLYTDKVEAAKCVADVNLGLKMLNDIATRCEQLFQGTAHPKDVEPLPCEIFNIKEENPNCQAETHEFTEPAGKLSVTAPQTQPQSQSPIN